MKILITGSNGFIGRNLQLVLSGLNGIDEVMCFDRDNTYEELERQSGQADAIFHFAGTVRPDNPNVYNTNVDLTDRLLQDLFDCGNRCPVMFASSIQAELNNPYGKFKRIEENKILEYGQNSGANTYIFRFPNLFGKMCRPNYTSVVATFCYNTVKGLPITVNNPATQMRFAYIETILENVCQIVFENNDDNANRVINIEQFYQVGLGELAYYMETLKNQVNPSIQRDDDFYKMLLQTYQWYRDNYRLYDI